MHAAATLLLALGGLLGLGPGEAGASETNCRLCVELVEAVEVWVQADAEMDFIVEEAIKICTGVGLPHALCETIIEAWLPGIIEGIVVNNLSPCSLCFNLGVCDTAEDNCAPGPTTFTPNPWVYIETALDGGRVLTLEPDNHHVWMAHKMDKDDQLWRLRADGCLESKSHQGQCLGLQTHTNGGQPYLQDWNNEKIQMWHYYDKYLVNQARSEHPVWVTNDLSLNVMWADIPLVTDGALVDVAKQDDTLSMKWNMVCHDTVCP